MEFVIKAQSGGTSHFFRYASSLLPPRTDETKTVIVDGAYGLMRLLEQFDTVVLLAGSSGASFCMPLLRQLVYLKKTNTDIATRKVRLVWVVKS